MPHRNEYNFWPPYCSNAETNYWRDLTQRLDSHQNADFLPIRICQITVTDDKRGMGDVVFKRQNFGDYETGIVINGPFAGYLVSPVARMKVYLGRPLARDGGYFNKSRALEHLSKLNLTPKQRKILTDQLTGANVSVPRILANILGWLEYPIDKQRFLENIRRANVRFDSQD